MADAEKALGNEKFKAGDYLGAITHFTNALEIEPNNVLYSNRSACYCGLRKCVPSQPPNSPLRLAAALALSLLSAPPDTTTH